MQDERDAWIFIGASLNEPFDDAASWLPALARQTSAYSALSQEQKEYLGRNLVPLLLARKDEFATSGHKLFCSWRANEWTRVMCALASFDVARHSHPLDCCYATNCSTDMKSNRPQIRIVKIKKIFLSHAIYFSALFRSKNRQNY